MCTLGAVRAWWKSSKVLGIVAVVPVTVNQHSTIQVMYTD